MVDDMLAAGQHRFAHPHRARGLTARGAIQADSTVAECEGGENSRLVVAHEIEDQVRAEIVDRSGVARKP